ncbi:hypothetical protein Pla111_09930 [Botrimarina hoheduenensis]|uniref:Uncharacterized protein n=2 Tax=Botrimarina hoheduenensis TaxID=2528000 RepID=A0A5C5W9P1_9BACT|nr:hypothetical protein Pla111_09930 [Botrimarina hoheduenensis]
MNLVQRVSPLWLIAAGLAGVALVSAGFTVPLLACLLLVGLGADADLGRRYQRAVATDPAGTDPALFAATLRSLHAALYAGLLFTAWGALLDASNRLLPGAPSQTLLAFDLVLCITLVVIRLRRGVAPA